MSKKYEDLLLEEIKALLKKTPPNVRIRVYYENEGSQEKRMKSGKKRYTLAQIGRDLSGIKQDIEGIKQDVKGLKQDVAGLKQDVAVLKQDVAGLKQDVAVLKQDVAGLKQDVKNINARLDYNGLKQLPESSNNVF